MRKESENNIVNIPLISVLIATRNRKDSIEKLLYGMQSIQRNVSYELIVADNSTENHAAELERKYSANLPLTVIHLSKPGKSNALNEAILRAQGELLVFADDDIRPDTNWLFAYQEACSKWPEVNVFGGRIKVNEGLVPSWIRQSYNLQTILLSEQDYGDQPRVYEFDEYPVGPNLAVRRRVLQSLIRPWPEQFGPGTSLPVGDEIFFLQKLSAPTSQDRLYLPDCIIYHDFNLTHIRFFNALKRCYQGGLVAGLHGRQARLVVQNDTTVFARVVSRVMTCRSLREMACILSRGLGFGLGLLESGRMSR